MVGEGERERKRKNERENMNSRKGKGVLMKNLISQICNYCVSIE
jgi:hypothetical protein